MPRAKQRFRDTIATVFVILYGQSCVALDFRNSNKADIVYFHNITSINNPKVVYNVSTKEDATRSSAARPTGKKWQVGRVSRKQYEIINMLWRKTNIFADEEDTFAEATHSEQLNNRLKDQADHLTPTPQKITYKSSSDSFPSTHPSTISFIEFYYLDENPDAVAIPPKIKLKEYDQTTETKLSSKALGRLGQFKNFVSRSPLFSFHLVDDTAYKREASSLQPDTTFHEIQAEPQIEMKVTSNNNFLQKILSKSVTPRYVKPSPNTRETTPTTVATPGDKVKFFEMYDSNTRLAVTENTTDSYKENEIGVEERIALEQVDKDLGHGPNKIRYAKKHVKGRDMALNFTQFINNLIKLNKQLETNTIPMQTARTLFEKSTVTPTWDDVLNYTSTKQIPTSWSKYPFAAVYVYERYQVHCDAAAISPYWLVSSAACLSRHREDPEGDRSAFIAYCGENWWNPERIAYVKYTLVHPRYHPKDISRRHLYNIGVIQVASSMSSSCPGWEPISIMSHQYVTELTGSMGSAVGWGLNRYDTSYASRDLPRHLLSVYENYIYSKDCPGNFGYRNTKNISEQAVANIYCLALPSYYGEDSDPVHGGMLLVGGKLIALYLQEERRRWGEQSAQYTGVWRLVPWVLEVAKDPEDMDFPFVR